MIKVSNIVILGVVILFHYGLFCTVFSSHPQKQYERNLTVSGTILEATIIEVADSFLSTAPTVMAKLSAQDIITTHNSENKTESIDEIPRVNPRSLGEKAKEKAKENEQVVTAKIETQRQAQINPSSQNQIAMRNEIKDSTQNRERSTNSQQFIPPSHKGIELGNRKPKYPELSLRRKEEGQVTLMAKVLPSGKAEYVRIHKSSGHARLDNAARTAAQKYRYRAAEQAGQKISYDYFFTVTFKIENN